MKTRRPVQAVLSALSAVPIRLAPRAWKRWHELFYWRRRKRAETTLSNEHYEYFYTTHFGLDRDFYRNKVVVDLGCGPRGSLEWADMTSRRIGIDPLAERYLELGARAHAMEYIAAPSERMPLPDGSCDVVCSFNSLDHVDSVEQTTLEIKRISRPGGLFLLLVEVNHPPTVCEPHELSPERVIGLFEPEFAAEDVRMYKPTREGIYDSILSPEVWPTPNGEHEGFLSVRFVRR